jgi:CRP/FNR family cyclic AMP-dependent transcriptional regulator
MNKDDALHNTARLLKAVSYFSLLDDAALKQVSQSAIRRMYEAGQVILLEGEPCAGLYIVESGWLKAVKIGMDGREQVLQTLGAGDVFNAVSVFTDAPNQATVTALEGSQVWIVRREVLLNMMEKSPALARLLLEQAEGEAVQRQPWATQAEMAARLGTVPDMVNRALRKLAEAGMIHVERHQIQILDKEGLSIAAQLVE